MDHDPTRRTALRCMGIGTGTLFALAGGVLTGFDLAQAAEPRAGMAAGRPLFVQISDSHIGFNKDANPDVAGTLTRSIALVNALPQAPAFIMHTGDITHLSKAAEFDHAAQLLSGLRVSELHTTPGEHDVTDGAGTEYFARYGGPSKNRGYYSFDHAGVHFVGLVNVMQFKAGGLASLGDEQLAWLKDDLSGRSASQPIVIFAHMPMWSIYEPWGWGSSDSDQVLALVNRFGSVTVLNGHIHQVVSKVEGHVTFHTARSTAYPQPAAGVGSGPGPLTVPRDQLPRMLGVTSVSRAPLHSPLHLTDAALA
ncbi:MAG TPA: metallophosphoesterase [Caulobacteraceae bacterium]|nr:metallophosphoesterase [Caulobacteraceae bacterium]